MITITEILMDKEEPSTVEAKLQIKDVAGDKKSKTYTLLYDSEEETSADPLQKFNKEVGEVIQSKEFFKYFEENIKSDKIVSYKVTRVTEDNDRIGTSTY